MSDSVLQQKLRNAGKQAEGTQQLLIQAADEITELKRRLTLETSRRQQVEQLLKKLADDMTSTAKDIGELLSGKKTD